MTGPQKSIGALPGASWLAQQKVLKPMTHRKGSPLPASLISRLERHDHLEVLRVTGLAVASYWRARAGGPVHHGTKLRLERALDEIEAGISSASV